MRNKKSHCNGTVLHEQRTKIDPQTQCPPPLKLDEPQRPINQAAMEEHLVRYNFTTLEYRDLDRNLTETYAFGGNDAYGYDGLRIYRYVLIDELVAALKAKNVPVQYGKRFSHVVKDTPENGVTFAFADGTTESTTILVGADGIHSTVRRYLYPDLETKFIGMAGITATVSREQLKLPPNYHIPVTITSSQGAFGIAPQQVDGSEVLIGKQQRVAAPDQPGWDREFVADKQGAIEFLQSDTGHFPDFVQNAVSYIDPNKVNKWPFFVVPKLEKWASENTPAHAIPPSAGQGINQAFEDVYILALLLGQANRVSSLRDALSFWQTYRQDRVDKILELNKQIDIRRMPSSDNVVGVDSGVVRGDFDLRWLYNPDFKKIVNDWVSEHEK
ncbi:uncharacterized protein TRUGW13939_07557 [Talaromyces rugulosus]|uniref:FAD-binding domain-containing protein n=1 Tax=Talaromyces rugulosus TaxID=121627 RepID=A0A7H8R259_TALRU|nr:uncharacterized protein TRUGW13939_07557 [Talaromyces rugulosus]QKX60412.1 hypothetical protein TRUGW13939_07557 [Talaromyces rugulosus]